MLYKPYVIMTISAATACLLSVAAQKVLALPNPAWEAQRVQAERYGDQETINKLKYLSTAGTLRYPPGNSTYAGTEYHASCCGEADAYEADDYEVDKNGNLIAILTCNDPSSCIEIEGKVVYAPGTKVKIPIERILVNHDPVNNTGHGWVWLAPSDHHVYCYTFPPGL